MLFSQVLKNLEDKIDLYAIQISNDPNITGLCALPVSLPYKEDILYIGKSILLDHAIFPNASLLYDKNTTLPPSCSTAQFDEKNLIHVIIAIQDSLNSETSISLDLFSDIIRSSIRSQTIDTSINALAQVLGNALILLDHSMHVIGYSTTFEIMDPHWKNIIETGLYPEAFYHLIRSNREIQSWKRRSLTEQIFLEGDLQPKLVSYYTEDDHLVCVLIMIEHHRPFNVRDKSMLSLACQLLYFLYSNTLVSGKNLLSAHSSVLYRLLDETNHEAILKQIVVSDLHFPEIMQMVTVRFITPTDNRFIKRSLTIELQAIFPEGAPVQYKSYMSILTPPITAAQKKDLSILAEREQLSAGISWQFEDLALLKTYFDQSVACIKQAEHFGCVQNVFEYSDYFFYDLLDHYPEKAQLHSFIHPGILHLRRYDKKHHSDMTDTLFTFLKHRGNVRKTAELLFIHRNTLLYRLKRIEELLDLDLNHFDVQNQLLTSMWIDSFLEEALH